MPVTSIPFKHVSTKSEISVYISGLPHVAKRGNKPSGHLSTHCGFINSL